ncbi:MPN domain-containing protein [Spirosoma rhododendri]|uniref:Uncharacterized protein n=1 Tax=Spirosoma rhododendri TaxID=2728024 RepID=A0A7L5DPZ0_9BACT|nr:hypothetical protein [Spirosoma rhododendri]QJD79541.1 hypothetical protein HH216_14815 [Spirosoma rhododendri]
MSLRPQDATTIYSVGEISVSYKTNSNPKLAHVRASRDAYGIFRQYWSEQINWIEEFYLMCLNKQNEAIGIFRVSVGARPLPTWMQKSFFR